jgi:hypothetical protein
VGEHREGDVPIPGVVATDWVVVEPDLGFGGLEALLDRPAGASYADEVLVGGVDGALYRTGLTPASDDELQIKTRPLDDHLSITGRSGWSTRSCFKVLVDTAGDDCAAGVSLIK